MAVLKSATDVVIEIVIALHLKQWCPGEQQLDPHTHKHARIKFNEIHLNYTCQLSVMTDALSAYILSPLFLSSTWVATFSY
jgi:hypothetical protein